MDFRCGHRALALIVQTELKLDPHSGVTIVFRSKRGDRLKILVWDGTGLVMIYKILEQGNRQRLADDRRGEKLVVVAARLERHARLLGKRWGRGSAVSCCQKGQYLDRPQIPQTESLNPRIEDSSPDLCRRFRCRHPSCTQHNRQRLACRILII